MESLHYRFRHHGLYVVLGYSMLVRILVFLTYDGASIFPDTGDYLELANLVLSGNLTGYHGARTLGYPLLLALAGNHSTIVLAFQNLMGLGTLAFFYKLIQKRVSNILAVYTSLALASYLPFVFYDFALLSEGFTGFLLMVIFYYLETSSILLGRYRPIIFVVLGLLCGLLFWVRPFFIYLPFLIAGFMVITHWKLVKKRFSIFVLLPLIPTFMLVGWNTFNYYNTGIFMVSSYEGINLSQVGTSFYEELPDTYKVERDILLKHRHYIETQGTRSSYPMTVWFAHKDLKAATGLNDLELSLRLKEMAKELILNNPALYAHQVWVSLNWFFGAQDTFLWDKEKMTGILLQKAIIGLWHYLQQYLLVALNLLFIGLGIYNLMRFRKRSGTLEQLIILSVFAGAVFQALITFGNNSRFCYPFTPLMLLVVVIFVVPKAFKKC